jgi:putative membrane protein
MVIGGDESNASDQASSQAPGQAFGPAGSDDPRIYFAAERTFLAWIRTGLGLMGVGFAVSRFGLFLREMRASEVHAAVHATGLSEYSGVALVALGVIVNVTATVQHIRTVCELRSGSWIAGRPSWNAIVLALLLAALGVGMGAYLLYLH